MIHCDKPPSAQAKHKTPQTTSRGNLPPDHSPPCSQHSPPQYPRVESVSPRQQTPSPRPPNRTHHPNPPLLLPPNRPPIPNRLGILALHPGTFRHHVRLDKPLQIPMRPRRAVLAFIRLRPKHVVIPWVLPRLARELFDSRVERREDGGVFGGVVEPLGGGFDAADEAAMWVSEGLRGGGEGKYPANRLMLRSRPMTSERTTSPPTAPDGGAGASDDGGRAGPGPAGSMKGTW